MKDAKVNYEVEFFNISELENVYTGETEPMDDIDFNKPTYGRYNLARVTETEYGTSLYYLLLRLYCIDGPEPLTLEKLFMHLHMQTKELTQDNKDDVYKIIDTGETMTVGEYFDKVAHAFGVDASGIDN